RVRRYCGLRVPGKIEVRDDGDESLCGVVDDLANLGCGIEPAVGLVRGAGQFDIETHGLAAGAEPHELGKRRDLDAPALVFGEMPDQDVELVERHPVDQLLDLGHALEVPSGIEQQRAPGKTRTIDDRARGNLGGRSARPSGRRQQLPYGHAAVEHALRRARRYRDATIADVD